MLLEICQRSITIVLLGWLVLQPAKAADSRVVVTIKPLHSLVAGVMGETGTPALLVEGLASPHDYALKPSQRALMQQANILFRIDAHFESFLTKALSDLPAHVRVISLAGAGGVTVLDHRKGGHWEPHDHRAHTHANHGDDHHHHHHDNEAHEHGHDSDHKHDEDHSDLHIWLDPENAIALTQAIARELSKVYPEHTAIYTANAAAQAARLQALDAELAARLEPIKSKPFIVFHDAYQYLERRYGLTAVGSITLEPGQSISAKRLQEIRQKLKETSAVCVFREPQFDDKLVNAVIDGTSVKSGTLDPESGAGTPGAELYFALMRNLATGLVECLG